jgi:phosphatidylethanolamine/phosphatidyl-N-methylethanolamine N-methyltransferase
MSPTPKLPNQAVYRFYAPLYDFLFGRTYNKIHRQTMELLDLKPGQTLLIPGVGTGLDIPFLPPEIMVTGVDISDEMLTQARLKETRAQITLLRMDAQKLEFPDNQFDAALLNLIVSVAPDGRAVFLEAWRTLKPGGCLVIFDKFAPETGQFSLLRRFMGWFFRLLGTDVNRKISQVVGQPFDAKIVLNQPSLFGGQYRILLLRK